MHLHFLLPLHGESHIMILVEILENFLILVEIFQKLLILV